MLTKQHLLTNSITALLIGYNPHNQCRKQDNNKVSHLI
jgi:hypothetical protein